jgi:type IV pilus assembly protein PilC
MKKILETLIHDTANGMYLSASMEKYGQIFGQLFVNIVRVGEQSGTLTENLTYLAEELKKKHELVSRVRGALIYPGVILVATIGIVVTLMVAVFPKILPVFAGLNIKLPLSTRILIAATHFLTTYTFWLIIGVLVFFVAIYFLSKQEWFKNFFDHSIMHVPVFGSMVMKVNLVNIARVLGLLLKSGVQIIEAVNITASALENRYYRHELRTAGETLRRGDFFSVYLAKNPNLFPPIFSNMIQVGENTGNLSENLVYLALYYEEDVDNFLKNLNSIIEPMLLLFMGLLVGFMALSVITPIYSISQSLSI